MVPLIYYGYFLKCGDGFYGILLLTLSGLPTPSTGLVATGRVFSITPFDPFTTGPGPARVVGFFCSSLSLCFCLVFSHIFYPCYGMARKVLRVTPLAGLDLLSVWGLGFLSYGEECEDFVTLESCMALNLSN